MTPHHVSAEQAQALANFIHRYWESYGARVRVTVAADRLSGFSVRVQLGPDGLPARWERPELRRRYLAAARHTWREFIHYINSEILPAHNKMGRSLDSAASS